MPAAAVVVYAAYAAAAVSVAATAVSMDKQHKAAKAAQKLATDTATYNANVDIAQAQQIDLDTNANIRAERAQDKVYLSRQKTAYAAAGVLSSGSPLSVEATTAGRLEQARLNEYRSSQQKQQYLYGAAAQGVLAGQAQARAIGIQDSANMLAGGAKILSTVAGAYNSGMFSSAGGSGPSLGFGTYGDSPYW